MTEQREQDIRWNVTEKKRMIGASQKEREATRVGERRSKREEERKRKKEHSRRSEHAEEEEEEENGPCAAKTPGYRQGVS